MNTWPQNFNTERFSFLNLTVEQVSTQKYIPSQYEYICGSYQNPIKMLKSPH